MEIEFKYSTGEPIREGDIIKIGSWDGMVETVINKRSHPKYVDYMGKGIMLIGPAFGRIHTRFFNEDLVLVRRKNNERIC